MSWRTEILDWCKNAQTLINDGNFHPKNDTKTMRKIYKNVKGEDRLEALSLCEQVLEATAYSIYEKGISKKLDPKLTQYYAQTLIPKQSWIQKDYFRWLVQYSFGLLAGRLLTPLGGIRLYVFASLFFTLIFSGIHLYLGIEWINNPTQQITFINAIYFSGMTLTTLGYGDIHPTTELGRIVAISQAFLGYLVLGLGVYSVTNFLSPYIPLPKRENLDQTIADLESKSLQFMVKN